MLHPTINETTVPFNPTVARNNGLARRIFKILGIAIGILAVLIVTSVLLATFVWNGLDAGQHAPHFSGTDLNGNPIHLEDGAGKPVMLTFWSPDCSACRQELPELQAIATDPNANFTLVTVVSKMPAAEVKQFMQSQGLTFPVLVDEAGAIAHDYEITGIPASYFINADGMIERSVIGAGATGDLQKNLFAWLNTCKLDTVCK